MTCKYCGYDSGGHAHNCPANPSPGQKAPTEARGLSGKVRYSGAEHEIDLLGSIPRDTKMRRLMEKMGADSESGYMPYKKAVELAKHLQPGDPTNPDKDFLNELRIAVQDALELDPDDDSLKAFTAVGTPLDKFHGVDGFITLTDGQREHMVTLDATLRQDKLEEGHKADIMIGELPMPEEDEDAYIAAVEALGSQVADRMKEEMGSR
jgi:hypothetical protein